MNGNAGMVTFENGVSMWTTKKIADRAIGFGSAVRVTGGPCDPYLAKMYVKGPDNIDPPVESIARAMTGKWNVPPYEKIVPGKFDPRFFKPKKMPAAPPKVEVEDPEPVPFKPEVKPLMPFKRGPGRPKKNASSYKPVGE